MQRWLQGNVRGTGIDLERQLLALNLSDMADSGAILERRLRALPDDTLIVPLRVLWLPDEAHGRRLRDLVLGNPHNPGWLLQKLDAAVCPGSLLPGVW